MQAFLTIYRAGVRQVVASVNAARKQMRKLDVAVAWLDQPVPVGVDGLDLNLLASGAGIIHSGNPIRPTPARTCGNHRIAERIQGKFVVPRDLSLPCPDRRQAFCTFRAQADVE